MNSQASNVNNAVGVGEANSNAGSTNTAQIKQSTGKQLVAFIFILALATKMFLLPIFLIQETGRDAYIALAIIGGFDLVTLGIIIATMYLSRETDLFSLITSVIGKVGARIVVGIFGLFLFLKLNIAISEILAFYGNNMFTDFDTSLMLIVFLAFLSAVGNHTLRSLCRLNEILVPIVVLGLTILTAIVIMTGFELANIFPSMQDTGGFTKGLIGHAAWLGDFTPLLMFVGRTKVKKHTGYFAAGAGVIGTTVAVFFALVMSAAFGNVPSLVDSTTNFSSILQFAIGNVYGRIDMFSSILWSISVFIEAALLFYATARCVAFVIGKNAHFWISLALSVTSYVTLVFALVDQTIFSVVVTSLAVSIIAPACTIAFPSLTFVCAIISRHKQKRLNEK
ncbi:MAG: GerAB/ArcD/ProY family transporter [Clostridiales bacterium]|nr:GerAB/ArcD/ProY family transporter [Clostridiales bacterium]